jgi:hypothetical protein
VQGEGIVGSAPWRIRHAQSRFGDR